MSRRIRFDGRTDDAIGRSETEVWGSFGVVDDFGFVADGNGEALTEVAPLV